MSSYIAFDLDALNLAPAVARASGMTEDSITAGLVRLWAWAFRQKTDIASALVVRGQFGGDCTDSLVAFEFLEKQPSGDYRVRGADRYLRVAEGRSRGGKMASGNLKRGTKLPGKGPVTEPESSPGLFPADAGEEPRLGPGLSPTTDDRTPNTEHREEEALPPVRALQFDVSPPTTPAETWSKEDFWRWAEGRRRAGGCQPEKWPSPVALGRWWTEARSGCRDVAELQEAFYAYGEDKHWQARKPALPFGGFMSQWNNFLPLRRPDAAS